MRKMQEKENEIPDEIVEKVTRKFLKKMSGHLRGTKIAVMNATIQESYNEFIGLPTKQITKLNFLQRIGREIAREMGINPNGSIQERKKYNEIKHKLRAKASEILHKDKVMQKTLEGIIKRKRFVWSAKIGKSKKLGPKFAKMSKWIKKKRNL